MKQNKIRYRTEGRIERLRLSAPMDLKSILSTSRDHPYLGDARVALAVRAPLQRRLGG